MTHTLEALRALAQAAAKSGLLPAEVRGPDAAFYLMAAGVEMGFKPVESLRALALVKGKVSVSAQGQLALAIRRGVRVEWPESTNETATIRLTREGTAPFTLTYTMQDAQRAGLAGQQTWKAHPAAMLRARAASAAVRAYCPDALLGVYDPDEVAELVRNDDAPQIATSQPVTVIDAQPEPLRIAADAPAPAVTELATRLDALAAAGWTKDAVRAFGATTLHGVRRLCAMALDGGDHTRNLYGRLGRRIVAALDAGILDGLTKRHGHPQNWLAGDVSEAHKRLDVIRDEIDAFVSAVKSAAGDVDAGGAA